jgi:hypothetical protein
MDVDCIFCVVSKQCILGNDDLLNMFKYSLQENRTHSLVCLYSSVPRNINGLYSSVLKTTNVGITNECRAHIFVG